MHNMRIEDDHFDHFSGMMLCWADLCEKHYADHSGIFPDLNLQNLREEIRRNEELIRNETTDLVYGHQDLLRGNVIRNQQGDILIIDFEYTCILAAPLDICHHFCEWMTHYDSPSYWIDMALHPTREEETNFLVAYLETRSRSSLLLSPNREQEALRRRGRVPSRGSSPFSVLFLLLLVRVGSHAGEAGCGLGLPGVCFESLETLQGIEETLLWSRSPTHCLRVDDCC